MYAREEASARAAANGQATTIAATAAASVDPSRAVLATTGDFASAATLSSQLTSIQLASPRVRSITVAVANQDRSEYRVAAMVSTTGAQLRAGSVTKIEPGLANAALTDHTVAVSRNETILTAFSGVPSDKAARVIVIATFDASGLGQGFAPAAFALAIGLAATLVFAAIVGRGLTRRLAKLNEGTERLAAGEMSYRVDIRGTDEIASLAVAFNSMADAIEENRSSLATAVSELGRASALAELRAEDNEQMLGRTVEAVDEERRRLAAELHDSTIQTLQSIGMQAEYVRMLMERGKTDEAAERVEELRIKLNEAIAELRRLLFDLRPPSLDDVGLEGAIEARLEDAATVGDLSTRLEFDAGVEVPRELETVVYRFCQEALANAVRHAAATSVAIRIWRYGPTLRVEVSDDGKGFDADSAAAPGHFGLQGMRERAELAGGALKIESKLGLKTRIELTLPLADEAGVEAGAETDVEAGVEADSSSSSSSSRRDEGDPPRSAGQPNLAENVQANGQPKGQARDSQSISPE